MSVITDSARFKNVRGKEARAAPHTMNRASSTWSAFIRDLVPDMALTASSAAAHAAVTRELGWDGTHCVYCGVHRHRLSKDHWVPVIQNYVPTGAGHDAWNIVASCTSCNHSKNNRDVLEWFDYKFKDKLDIPDVKERRSKLLRYNDLFKKHAMRWHVTPSIVSLVRETRDRIYAAHATLSDMTGTIRDSIQSEFNAIGSASWDPDSKNDSSEKNSLEDTYVEWDVPDMDMSWCDATQFRHTLESMYR